MSKFMMLIGPTGCGKSTVGIELAKDGAIILSSDKLREEVWGDASDQQKPGIIFDLMYRRTVQALNDGFDVVYDATNLSSKKRTNLLANLAKVCPDLKTECHLVLTEPNVCLSNQLLRERQVPDYVVHRHMTQFSVPSPAEGWTEPIYVHNTFYRSDLMDELTKDMVGCSQTGKWHLEPVDVHTLLVVNRLQQRGASELAIEAARVHDIGKPYCRSVDEDGNTHFYGHAQAGAYLYLCAVAQTGALSDEHWKIAMLINHHMDFMNNGEPEKTRAKVGDELYGALVQLHEADEYGAVRAEDGKMPVLDFMNKFEDWEMRLRNSPFSIVIKREGDYTLLKYSQLNSDMSLKPVQQSRGSIFKMNKLNEWAYVCRPFDKFFNYGQGEADDIEWASARILEKVDGSLLKVFYDNDEWHLATNGNIDAFKAPVSDLGYSYGDVFNRALGYEFSLLGAWLDPAYTYMFELTSPDTQLVVPYPDGVWYLSRRHTETGVEQFERPALPGVKLPKEFKIANFADVLAMVQNMPKEEEGVVVNDAYGHRIKIKSPEYLMAAHLSNNKMVSNRNLVEYMKEDKLDDFLAYCPQYTPRVDVLLSKFNGLCEQYEAAWERMSEFSHLSRKEFAALAAKDACKAYIFYRLDNPQSNASNYLLSQTTPTLMRLLGLKSDELGYKPKDEHTLDEEESLDER